MDTIESKGEHRTVTSTVFDRLDRVARYAEGFFIRKSVAQNDAERRALEHIVRRNIDFMVPVIEGSGIYRLSQGYLSRRGILQIFKTYDKFHLQALRRALWGAFILEHEYSIQFSDEGRQVGGIPYKIDNLLGDYSGYEGIVVSVPQRLSEIKAQTYVPKFLHGKLIKESLDKFLALADIPRALSIEEIRNHHFLLGAIWPDSEDDCHEDKREYPLWKSPVSGKTKWIRDRELLETGERIVGYKFGVYPR